ncbi:uncharacterized protein [Lepisosteus oculatus]|uniref:uncharacterized protein n=1 Tax=Lepisosteus oculatus TaxID=7918 RepID=UPI0035F50E8E
MGLLLFLASLFIAASFRSWTSARSIGPRGENSKPPPNIIQTIWLVGPPLSEDPAGEDGLYPPLYNRPKPPVKSTSRSSPSFGPFEGDLRAKKRQPPTAQLKDAETVPESPAKSSRSRPFADGRRPGISGPGAIPREQVAVWCGGGRLFLSVKSKVNGVQLKPGELTLGTGCKSTGASGDRLLFDYGLGECGTRRSTQQGQMVCRNVLRYVPSAGKLPIRRSSPFNVPVKCALKRFQQSSWARFPFMHSGPLLESRNSYGWALRAMDGAWKGVAKSNVYSPGQPIRFQASATLRSKAQRLSVQSCYATSLPGWHTRPRYKVIVKKGCVARKASEELRARFVSTRARDTVNFVIDAFRLSSSKIYMHCVLAVVNDKITEGNKLCNYNPARKRWDELNGGHAACKCCRGKCRDAVLRSLPKDTRSTVSTGPLVIVGHPATSTKAKWDTKPSWHRRDSAGIYTPAEAWSLGQKERGNGARLHQDFEEAGWSPLTWGEKLSVPDNELPFEDGGNLYNKILFMGELNDPFENLGKVQVQGTESMEGFQQDWSLFSPEGKLDERDLLQQEWNLPLEMEKELEDVTSLVMDRERDWNSVGDTPGHLEWLPGDEPKWEEHPDLELDFVLSLPVQSDAPESFGTLFPHSSPEGFFKAWAQVPSDYERHDRKRVGDLKWGLDVFEKPSNPPVVDVAFLFPSRKEIQSANGVNLDSTFKGRRQGVKPRMPKLETPKMNKYLALKDGPAQPLPSKQNDKLGYESLVMWRTEWLGIESQELKSPSPQRKAISCKNQNINSNVPGVFLSRYVRTLTPGRARSLQYEVVFEEDNGVPPKWRRVHRQSGKSRAPNLMDLLGLSKAE